MNLAPVFRTLISIFGTQGAKVVVDTSIATIFGFNKRRIAYMKETKRMLREKGVEII